MNHQNEVARDGAQEEPLAANGTQQEAQGPAGAVQSAARSGAGRPLTGGPAEANGGSAASFHWHALEIHSSDDGNDHHPEMKLGRTSDALLHATDPTERLLPAEPGSSSGKAPIGSASRSGSAASAVLPGGISRRQRRTMVVLFSLTAALLFADQNLMAPNLTAIATDFGFDERQRDRFLGGYIAAAFYMVGAPAALLFGYLSDKYNRKWLLFSAVLLGEAPCILTVFVTNYWQLFTLRLLTGIALGGALPVVFSLLGDLYDPSSRAGVSSIVQLSTGVGLALGQGIAGFVGPAWGWRWPFLIVAIPTVTAAFAMLYCCQEPLRGGTEAALKEQFQEHSLFVYKEEMSWRKLRRLLLIPTNIMALLQGLFGCVPWGMILTYLNDFLSQNKGLSVQHATMVLLVLGIGGAVGVVGGGVLGQWLYNRRKWSMSVFIGVCTILGCIPMYFLINAGVASVVPLTIVCALLAGGLSGTVGPNMRAMILNVNEPEQRGIALAIQTTMDDLGKGLGPVFVAFFIEKLGRTAAFNLSTAAWIPCGLLLIGTGFSLARDEDAMQHRLRKVISSYTFSSSALSHLEGGEDASRAEEAYREERKEVQQRQGQEQRLLRGASHTEMGSLAHKPPDGSPAGSSSRGGGSGGSRPSALGDGFLRI